MVKLSLCIADFAMPDSPAVQMNFTLCVVIVVMLLMLLYYSYLNYIHNKVMG
jgi:hypothetical protein